MNPIITEQLNKFKTGDFSGYESFYNETVNTVYTMLHTIVEDQNVATSLVPQVYDKIYQNATSLEQTERFYQWAAELANEETLGYLKGNGLTEIRHDSAENKNAQMITADGQEETEQFYDYAVEDAALTITEEVVTDTSFVTKLQEIVNTLSPMERIAFQDYYYFGISVPEIAAKTGCKDTDIRYTLSQTRTSILQTIAATPAYATGYGNPNVRKYHLAQAPWLWIAYQNFLGYTLGIDTISIAGWAMGVLGQAVGSGIAIGAEGMIAGGASGAGAVTGVSIAGGTAGEISAGATIGAATAGGAGAAGTSGIAAGFFGTIGGKIAIGIVGAAMATAIGVGVHHVVTENQTTTEVVTTTEASSETTEKVTETTSETTTEVTTEATTEATTEEVLDENVTDYASYDEVLTDLKQQIEQYDPYNYSYEDTKFAKKSLSRDIFYVIDDIDGDGTEELVIAFFNAMKGMDIGDIFTMRNGKIVKMFTNKYGYGDNGQGAFLYNNDGRILEMGVDSIAEDNSFGIGYCYYDICWRIEGGRCNFDCATVQYGEVNNEDRIIYIYDEKALNVFLDTAEAGLSAAQNLVDSDPETYVKSTEDDDFDYDVTKRYAASWQPLYEDNEFWNSDYGPKPDADGKFW